MKGKGRGWRPREESRRSREAKEARKGRQSLRKDGELRPDQRVPKMREEDASVKESVHKTQSGETGNPRANQPQNRMFKLENLQPFIIL